MPAFPRRPSPQVRTVRRELAYLASHSRRLSPMKEAFVYTIGFLIGLGLLLFSDPAFLQCNRWIHEASCSAQSASGVDAFR